MGEVRGGRWEEGRHQLTANFIGDYCCEAEVQGVLSMWKNPAQSGAIREGFLEELPLGGALESEYELMRWRQRSWQEEGPECVQNVC